MPIRISQISFHHGLAQKYEISRGCAHSVYSILICIAARSFILCMFTMPCPATSFNAKPFRHFSTSWQALREASVRSITKIGKHFCRQGISKAPSWYNQHKSMFSYISAMCFTPTFFYARSCADFVSMHSFCIIFHAAFVSASLLASSFVHLNSSTVSLQSRSHVSRLHQHVFS